MGRIPGRVVMGVPWCGGIESYEVVWFSGDAADVGIGLYIYVVGGGRG